MGVMPMWLAAERDAEARLRAQCEPQFVKVFAQFQRGLVTVDELIQQLARIRYAAQ